MFGNYNRRDYLEPTLVDRIAGSVAWVGAAAIGLSVVKKGGLHKGVGTFLNSIGDNAAIFGLKSTKGSLDSAITTMSGAVQDLINAPRRTVSSLVTQRAAHLRSEQWMDYIRTEVADQDSLDLLESRSKDIKNLLFKPLTATESKVAKNTLLASEWVDGFRKLTDGVKFRGDSKEYYTKMIASASDSWTEITRETYREVMSSEHNQETVYNAVMQSVNKRRKQYSLFEGLKTADAKELTYSDLLNVDDEGGLSLTNYGKQLNEYAEKHMGFKSKKSEGFVEQTYQRFHENVKKSLGAEGDRVNLTPSQELFMKSYHEELMQTQTGWMVHEGRLIPKAKTLNNIGEKFQRAFNEVSIPLLPGAFQVQASRLFNFIKSDNSTVRNLGRAIAQPELRRAGFKFGTDSGLTKVGESILEFNPESMELHRLEGNYATIATRGSKAAKEFQRVRNEEPLTYLEEMYAVAQSNPTLIGKIKGAFKGDPKDWSRVNQVSFENQHHWMTAHISNDGRIVAVPTKSTQDTGIDKFLFDQFQDATNIDPSELNIKVLQGLLETDVQDRPFLKTDISREIIKQASKNRSDILPFLRDSRDYLLDNGNSEVMRKLHSALGNANSTSEFWDSLQAEGLFDSEVSEDLKAFPELFEALEKSKLDREGFLFPAPGHNRLTANIQGYDTPSELNNNLQSAILNQILEVQGKASLESRGVTENTLLKVLQYHQTGANKSQEIDTFYNLLEKTFNLDSNEVERFSKYLLSGLTETSKQGEIQISSRAYGDFARLFNPIERPGVSSYNKLVGARIAGAKSDSIFHIQNNIIQDSISVNSSTYNLSHKLANDSAYGRLAALQEQMASAKTIQAGIQDNPYRTPRAGNLDQTNATGYFVVEQTFDFESFLEDPVEMARRMLENGKTTIASLFDNTKPVNKASYALTVLGQMSNQLGSEIGLGLNVQDKMNATRYLRAVMLKRILPVAVGVELYNNINADADEIGIPGIDDGFAQLRANISLSTASIGDMTGITPILKRIINSVPGAETWLTPRSRREYEHFLAYGSEAIREGQGWLIGNKGAFRGGAVDYYIPNYYRRGTSGWKSAANGITDPNWSWVPTPLHPFAPIHKLLDPGKFIREHRYDRPYIDNGLGPEFGTQYSLNNVLYGGVNGGLNYGLIGTEGAGSGYGVEGGGLGGEQGGGGPGGAGVGTGNPGEEDAPKLGWGSYIQHLVSTKQVSLTGSIGNYLNRYREQGGLYGGIIKSLPFWPQDNKLNVQRASDTTDFRRLITGGGYGEFLGSYGEYFRRMLGGSGSSTNDYSPYRNLMPSWIKDPKWHSGDPYVRYPHLGELVLPGEALERASPWIRPMKARGSMLGDSEDEIIKKMLDPVGEAEDTPFTRFGSYAHLAVQNKLRDRGILLAAEIPLYDEEHNISGTMDAVVNGSTGREIIDIKTQNSKDFERGVVSDKYLDQLNFYLVTTGSQRGHLAFVNSDDPTQVRFHSLDVDKERYNQTILKIEKARHKIQGMIDNRLISPYETYDALSRLTVLSKISPHSEEVDELINYIEGGGGGLNSQEKLVYDTIKKETTEARKRYRTIAYRNPGTRQVDSKVLAINSDGTILTEAGNIRLAGIEFDRQAFNKLSAEELYEAHGIKVGERVTFGVNQGVTNETMQHTTVSGIFAGLNKRLVTEGYATMMSRSDDPTDHVIMGGAKGPLRSGLEWLLHRDFYIFNKLWRVRSPVEQLERGEAFGTDTFRWNDLGQTLIAPTITSIASKNPLEAALVGGLTTSTLLTSKQAKSLGFKIGAGIAGGLALIRTGYDILNKVVGNDSVWTAPRYKKQQEIDEYYDVLEYIKAYSQAETIRQKALEKGYDLDKSPDTAPNQIRNAYYRAVEKAQSTMYAYDTIKGTLDEALAAIPYRHQQLAKEVILYSKQSEKDRFYELLSSPEKKVLGRFLNHPEGDKYHQRKPLTEFFKKFKLPEASWRGWDSDVDLGMLSKATSVAEGTLAAGLSKEDRAFLEADGSITVPQYRNNSLLNVKETLHAIQNKVDVPVLLDLKMTPSETNNVNLSVDIRTTSRNSDLREIERDLKRV